MLVAFIQSSLAGGDVMQILKVADCPTVLAGV